MLGRYLTSRLSRRTSWPDYLLAVGLAAVGLCCRLILEVIDPGSDYVGLLIPAIVLSGVFCGTGPAIVCTAFGALAAAALSLSPFSAHSMIGSPRVLVLATALTCGAMLWATATLRRFAADAAAAEARLAEVFREFPGAAAIIEAPNERLLLRSRQSDIVLGHNAWQIGGTGGAASYGGLHPDGSPLLAEQYPILRALRRGESVVGERLTYRQPGGRVVELEVYAGPIRGAGGDIVAAVGMAFDISARAEAERRLEHSEAQHRAAATRLTAALEARDLLMREADHRIKNSLQLVVALLQFQRSRASNSEVSEALAAAIVRVDGVADAHLALQSSPDLRSVDIDQILLDLCSRVGLLNPAVTLRCRCTVGRFLDAGQAIPLGLVASELLTNALRHAYPPGTSGEVLLTATLHGGILEMIVTDAGVGLPVEPPASSGRGGLGSTVVAALASQIGASMTTHSTPGAGTTITLRLALVDV